jgi:hypothetical protein
MGCSQKINSDARLPGQPRCVKKTEPPFAPAADLLGRGRVLARPGWRVQYREVLGKGRVLARHGKRVGLGRPGVGRVKCWLGEMSVRGGRL